MRGDNHLLAPLRQWARMALRLERGWSGCVLVEQLIDKPARHLRRAFIRQASGRSGALGPLTVLRTEPSLTRLFRRIGASPSQYRRIFGSRGAPVIGFRQTVEFRSAICCFARSEGNGA